MSNLIKIDYTQANELYNAGYTITRARRKNPPTLNRDKCGKSWVQLKVEGYFNNGLPFYVDITELSRAAMWARETNWQA